MDLKNKSALVTGGAVRLGKALALALADQGMNVAIHYGSSAGPAEETVKEIKSKGVKGIAVSANFSKPFDAANSLMDSVTKEIGELHVLVNSAAIFKGTTIQETTEENWDIHQNINLKAPFFLSQAFAKHVSNRKAHIVNIADWRALRPSGETLSYTIAKGGIVTMTKSLALGLAPNIQVNAIAPGAILPPPDKGQSYLDKLAATIPAKRSGSPAEIAKALVFLLKSDFVTGEIIHVTGGEHL